MTIGTRIFLAVSALILVVLVAQAGVNQVMVSGALQGEATRQLARTAADQAAVLADILTVTGQDLPVFRSHKALDDYFTARFFEDADGMATAEGSLEFFFRNLGAAKPQYEVIQITAADGRPVLQIQEGQRVETFVAFPQAAALEALQGKSGADGAAPLFLQASQQEDGSWALVSALAVVVDSQTEGLIWLRQPLAPALAALANGAQAAGMAFVIQDSGGRPVAASPDLAPEAQAALGTGQAAGWLVAGQELPGLGWQLTLGIEEAQAFAVLRRMLFTAVLVLAAALAAAGGALWLLVRGITRPVQQAITDMEQASTVLTSEAQKVNDAGQALAAGVAQQAAAMEQMSASMEEIGAMTRNNADNAGEADGLMRQANEAVGRAFDNMERLTASMNEVAGASAETRKIVRTIDEIAFQTNLLALNAAVEAARAGEAGAGFAVVADEVRSLARRAAEAAKSTATLIDNTARRVADGSQLVTVTGRDFQAVTGVAEKAGLLVAEIAAASAEQSRAIEQVSRGIVENDKVTQRNAGTAEDSASAATVMKEQVERLDSSIHELQALVGGSGRRAGSTALVAAGKAG
ncbi:MAG: methyl-accepting chemotaxis protein [Thermodesulfobacteriota bacterium]